MGIEIFFSSTLVLLLLFETIIKTTKGNNNKQTRITTTRRNGDKTRGRNIIYMANINGKIRRWWRRRKGSEWKRREKKREKILCELRWCCSPFQKLEKNGREERLHAGIVWVSAKQPSRAFFAVGLARTINVWMWLSINSNPLFGFKKNSTYLCNCY